MIFLIFPTSNERMSAGTNLFLYNNNYYLSAGLGVIVLDGYRFEVNESWFIGNGGNTVKVNGFTSDGNFFYAATDEGLKRATVNSANFSDYLNWQMMSGINGLSKGLAGMLLRRAIRFLY